MRFDIACGVKDWRLHDLRRTARSLMSRAGVNPDVAERCLGHVIRGVRGTYDRHRYIEEMRVAFEKLSALIETIVRPQPNVLPMEKKISGLTRIAGRPSALTPGRPLITASGTDAMTPDFLPHHCRVVCRCLTNGALEMTTIDRRAFACGTSLVALSAFPTLAEVSASPDHKLLVWRPASAGSRRGGGGQRGLSCCQHPMLDKAWDLTLATGSDAKSNAASEMYHDIALQLHRADPRIGELDRAQNGAWKRYDMIAAQIVARYLARRSPAWP